MSTVSTGSSAGSSNEPNGAQPRTGTARVKRGMAEMLKGGVIMDVVTPEQAKIAEDAGAVAVMALERVPADIRARRRRGPHVRPGHDRRHHRRGVDPGDGQGPHRALRRGAGAAERSASTTSTSPRCSPPPTRRNHIDKWAFTVPFVCGATNLGEALRRITEGAAMIRSKGEAGTGNVVEATRHMRQIRGDIRRLTTARRGRAVRRGQGAAGAVRAGQARSPRPASCPSSCSPPAASPPRPTPR